MDLWLYSIGGFILWLGVYSHIKTRNDISCQPIDQTGLFIWILFGYSDFLVIPFLIGYWIQYGFFGTILFLVVGGVLSGLIFGAGQIGRILSICFWIFGIPLGSILIGISFLF